jgi:rhodanese-related sulfurtransferase
MLKIFVTLFTILLMKLPGCAQPPADRPFIKNPDFDKKISRTISFTVPTIGVQDLKNIQREVFIFDAREKEEYDVSHIKGAKYIGYDDFDINRLAKVPKDSKIVVYCSIGYRSEKIGERLKKLGYSNVFNLYGSIFEWVNQGCEVVNETGAPTNKIHTYNKDWSRWVDEQNVKKIW